VRIGREREPLFVEHSLAYRVECLHAANVCSIKPEVLQMTGGVRDRENPALLHRLPRNVEEFYLVILNQAYKRRPELDRAGRREVCDGLHQRERRRRDRIHERKLAEPRMPGEKRGERLAVGIRDRDPIPVESDERGHLELGEALEKRVKRAALSPPVQNAEVERARRRCRERVDEGEPGPRHPKDAERRDGEPEAARQLAIELRQDARGKGLAKGGRCTDSVRGSVVCGGSR
jgi:hypothetical protein